METESIVGFAISTVKFRKFYVFEPLKAIFAGFSVTIHPKMIR